VAQRHQIDRRQPVDVQDRWPSIQTPSAPSREKNARRIFHSQPLASASQNSSHSHAFHSAHVKSCSPIPQTYSGATVPYSSSARMHTPHRKGFNGRHDHTLSLASQLRFPDFAHPDDGGRSTERYPRSVRQGRAECGPARPAVVWLTVWLCRCSILR
jgi:hypothetical protein